MPILGVWNLNNYTPKRQDWKLNKTYSGTEWYCGHSNANLPHAISVTSNIMPCIWNEIEEFDNEFKVHTFPFRYGSICKCSSVSGLTLQTLLEVLACQPSSQHLHLRLSSHVWPDRIWEITFASAELRGGTKGSLTLMINSAKSSCFCIPMVPRLSGGHVTCVEEIGGER